MNLKASIIIFFGISGFAYAQDKKIIDSLQTVYSTTQSDTLKILLLSEIGKQYHRSKPDTAIIIAERAFSWADKLVFEKGKARALNIIGLGYWVKSNHALALQYFQESVPLFLNAHDKKGCGLSLNNIGLVYYYQNDFEQALNYYKQALQTHEEINYAEGIALTSNNIGLTYEAQGDPTKALIEYEKALKIYRTINNKFGIGQSLTNLGYIYYYEGNLSKALEYQQQAVQVQEETRDLSTLTSSLIAIAEIYQKQKQYDKCAVYAQRALQTAKEIKTPYDAREASRVLYEIHKANQNPALALQFMEMYKVLSDSIFSVEKSKAIAALETRVQLEKKQKELEVLEEQKQLRQRINYLASAGLIASLIFTYFLFRNKRKLQSAYDRLESANTNLTQAKEKIETQAYTLQQTNQTKDKIFSIVSHDLRSPLHSLKALLQMMNENILTETEFRVLLSDVRRGVTHATDIAEELLHWSSSQMETMEVKSEIISLGEVFQSKRERFKQQAAEKNIKILAEPTPFQVKADLNMIKAVLRNLVANAIKFTHPNGAITLKAIEDGNYIRISIEDTGTGIAPENIQKIFNGQGFTTYGTAKEKGTGLGLMLCRDFVAKNNGRLSVESTLGKGTIFYFNLPKVV